MEIKRYTKSETNLWNQFVKNSKNGTFLFDRNYMEYHSDRFIDFSLMIYDDKSSLIALLPASKHDYELRSHGGLTYGGFVVNHTMKAEKMLNIFERLIDYLKDNQIQKIVYKAIPHIYHIMPAEEDLYSLFRYRFELFRRDVSSTINMRTKALKGQKINGFKKALKEGMKFEETNDSKPIIDIVDSNLIRKYGTRAVHTGDELNLLKSRFKKNIMIYNLVLHDEIVGGAILYIDNNVVHAQYITTTFEAKKKRGLDFLVVSIVEQFKNEYEWFDFGISTENNGLILNKALLKSKEEFNMSSVCYDTYRLEVK